MVAQAKTRRDMAKCHNLTILLLDRRTPFQEHVITLDGELIEFDACRRLLHGLSGYRIDLPTVPWADNFAIQNNSIRQRTAPVWTNIVHGREGAIDASNTNRPSGAVKFPGMTFDRKFRRATDPDFQAAAST